MVTTIPKEEAIKFLIEQCYKNFTELIEMIPEDKMYNRLNENISIIIGHDITLKNYEAFYNAPSKKITLLGIQEGEEIENIKHALAHEGIHALFRKNSTDTGINKSNKHFFSVNKIIGIAKTSKKRFTSNRSILSEMKILKQLLADKNYIKDFGEAFNEGFTEWCTGKSVGEPDSYLPQVRIIEILECILGTKEVLKMGEGNDKEIAKMLNMNMTEYNVFMAQMDEILFLKNIQQRNNSKSNGKSTKNNEIIENAKDFAAYEVIDTLIEKLIIPHFEQDNKPTLDNWKKLCKIDKLMSDFSVMNALYLYSPLSMFLSKKLNDIINSGNFKVDELSFKDCNDILSIILITEDNLETSDIIHTIQERMDSISENRFPIIEDNTQDKNYTSIKFEPIENEPKKTIKTFFRKFIDKGIKFKNLTMEDIEQTRETEKIKEGEQEIE